MELNAYAFTVSNEAAVDLRMREPVDGIAELRQRLMMRISDLIETALDDYGTGFKVSVQPEDSTELRVLPPPHARLFGPPAGRPGSPEAAEQKAYTIEH